MVADTVMVEYVSLVSLEVMVRLPVYRKSAQEAFLDCNMASHILIGRIAA